MQKYKDFIYHIIEQDKEKAKRFKRKNENLPENNHKDEEKKEEKKEENN